MWRIELRIEAHAEFGTFWNIGSKRKHTDKLKALEQSAALLQVPGAVSSPVEAVPPPPPPVEPVEEVLEQAWAAELVDMLTC